MRMILAVAAAAALALGGCGSSKTARDTASSVSPDSSDKKEKKGWFGSLKVEPAPQEVTPGKRRQAKRPGLISGEDGVLTVYQKNDRGSADPSKPEKVRR